MSRNAVDGLAALAVNGVVAAALVGAFGWPGPAEPRLGWPLALVTGAAIGYALFAVLARAIRPEIAVRGPLAPLAATATLLVLASIAEELVRRGVVLGATAPEVGPVAAFLASTIGFALVHREPRAIAANLLTGACFGGILLATGSLTAAIAAHASYNVAVLLVVATRHRPSLALALALAPSCRRAFPALTPVVEARGIEKRFRSIQALRGFDLEVGAGEVVALLGPNGSGKTTAIHVLLGLRRPDAGSARVLGLVPGDVDARRRVGVTLQEMACPPTLRVCEVVSFAAAHFGVETTAGRFLRPYRLEHLHRRQVGGLSGGERRRLAVALAFVGDPTLVFLDEPTTGLDIDSRRRIWAAVRDFAASRGTVLLTTHSLEEAEALATRVAVMSTGRVVAIGTPRAIKREAGTSTLEDAVLALTGPRS